MFKIFCFFKNVILLKLFYDTWSWFVSIKLGKNTTIKRIPRMVDLGFTLFPGIKCADTHNIDTANRVPTPLLI